jgi:hypothetical protein
MEIASLYLCWKTFAKEFHFKTISRMGVCPYLFVRSIPHDQNYHLRYLHGIYWTLSRYPPSIPRKLPFLLKTIFKTKPTQLCNTFPTAHDRGLGYSNRCTLCRGCALYPQDSIHPPWSTTDRHTQVCGVRIISQSLSLADPSIGTYPMGLFSPARMRDHHGTSGATPSSAGDP